MAKDTARAGGTPVPGSGRGRWSWPALVAAMALVAVACSSGSPAELRTEGAFSSVTRPRPTTTTEPPTTTTEPPTTTTADPAGGADLTVGSRGPAVEALEARLSDLRYDVGPLDGLFDVNTQHAVMAFQKTEGLSRTGIATASMVRVLERSELPPAAVPGGGDNRVEIDLDAQVLRLYRGGDLLRTLSVSTGTNEIFCSQGRCRRAVTPTGAYRIYEQRRGWETSPLGRLYNSNYFNGGIAIHGSPSVPATPASHGCVRIPMASAEWFPTEVHVGTPVYVYGNGAPPPPPLAEEPPPTAAPLAPPEEPPATTAPLVTEVPAPVFPTAG